MNSISYLQAIVTGFVQGITELFPVSSLGHAVLLPAWLDGSWKTFTTDPNSPYLAITVAFHFASAIALFWVFRKRWFKLISSGFSKPKSNSGNVFWLIVIATIPVGLFGFIFEHRLRELFAKPLAASIFLTINGLILISAERISKAASRRKMNEDEDSEISEHISRPTAVIVGFGESLALFAGISRFGITTSVGMMRKLSHHVAADFAFLAALPVILAAAVLKVPDLFKSEYADMRGQILLGSIVSLLATYFSVTFLIKWFKTKNLYPFAIYCLVVGVISIIHFG